MTKGAIHPNGSNFKRVARLDVVARVRRLVEHKMLREEGKPPSAPRWLEWCERVPPMENHSLHLQARTIRNPYPQMVNFLLKKYPDLRFQDCYVDGNDWSVGNDTYRDDHPVMQFVARQLDFMRSDGLSKKEAFARTEDLFRARREHLEREQKVMMAMALDAGLSPMFTSGRAYLDAERARVEAAHLEKVRQELQTLKRKAKEAERLKEQENAEAAAAPADAGQADTALVPPPLPFEQQVAQAVREATLAAHVASKEREALRKKLVGRVQDPVLETEVPVPPQLLRGTSEAEEAAQLLLDEEEKTAAWKAGQAALEEDLVPKPALSESERPQEAPTFAANPRRLPPVLQQEEPELVVTPSRALRATGTSKRKDPGRMLKGGGGVLNEDGAGDTSTASAKKRESEDMYDLDEPIPWGPGGGGGGRKY